MLPVGALVRLDQVYDLVEGNIGSEVRAKIASIRQGVKHPLAQPVAKVICLLQYVKSVHRSAENIAAGLHAGVESDSRLAEVKEALLELETSYKVRQGDDGYRIPTPAEDDWERLRNASTPSRGTRIVSTRRCWPRSGSRSRPSRSSKRRRSRRASRFTGARSSMATSSSTCTSRKTARSSSLSPRSCGRGANRSGRVSSGPSRSMSPSTGKRWSCFAPRRSSVAKSARREAKTEVAIVRSSGVQSRSAFQSSSISAPMQISAHVAG